MPTLSPYEAARDGDLTGLHPKLRAYFAAIPAGQHGLGRGIFTSVGTPRRWLWPVLAVLARDGVLFPVWERNVPFLVVNRPGPARVDAVRRFDFRDGSRDMIDATERFGDGDQRQHVRVTVTVPLVGTLYEYAGSFRYSVESGEPPA